MVFIPASFASLLPALVIALSAPSARAAGVDDARAARLATSRWQLGVSVVSGTPATLPGLAIGGVIEVTRRLGAGPWFVSTQVSLATASAATESWTIEHRQLIVAAGLGASRRLGAGRIWVEAGAGTLGLEEVLGRHQLERIQMADLGSGKQTSFAFAPYGFGELGVAVLVWDRVSARLSGGPIASRLSLASESTWNFGALAKVGASYDF